MGLSSASGQGPALPPALHAPGSQHLLLPDRDASVPTEDGPPAGGWAVTEAAARPHVGSVHLAVAKAGASVTPLFGWGH